GGRRLLGGVAPLDLGLELVGEAAGLGERLPARGGGARGGGGGRRARGGGARARAPSSRNWAYSPRRLPPSDPDGSSPSYTDRQASNRLTRSANTVGQPLAVRRAGRRPDHVPTGGRENEA